MGQVGGAGGIGAPLPVDLGLVEMTTVTPAANSTSDIHVYDTSPSVSAGETIFLKVTGTGGVYLNMGASTVDDISDISGLESRSIELTGKSNIFDTSLSSTARATGSVPINGRENIAFDFGSIASRILFFKHNCWDSEYLHSRIQISDNDADWALLSAVTGETFVYYWATHSFRYLRWYESNSYSSVLPASAELAMLGVLEANETLDVFAQHTASELENYPMLLLNKAGAITWFIFKGELR